jgi:hypothetical protein
LKGSQKSQVWLVLAFANNNRIAVLSNDVTNMLVMIDTVCFDSVWCPISFIKKRLTVLRMKLTMTIEKETT